MPLYFKFKSLLIPKKGLEKEEKQFMLPSGFEPTTGQMERIAKNCSPPTEQSYTKVAVCFNNLNISFGGFLRARCKQLFISGLLNDFRQK